MKDKHVGIAMMKVASEVTMAIALEAEAPTSVKDVAELFSESIEVGFQTGLLMGARLGVLSPTAAAALTDWWQRQTADMPVEDVDKQEAATSVTQGAMALWDALEPGHPEVD